MGLKKGIIMIKFLDGAATTAQIKVLVQSSTKVRMAVAFWGDGATEGLGLNQKEGEAVTVICNLNSGGTNPNEIRELWKAKINPLQCDKLHGKVYLFDDCVIIGSSNASSNGLALQGNELAGWHEANVLSDDQTVYNDAERWFNQLLTRPIIDDADFKAAEDAFKRRRGAGQDTWPDNMTLLDALRQCPEKFKDKEFYSPCQAAPQAAARDRGQPRRAARNIGAARPRRH
jgi:phosphatidylserine/phosphatidylglycerophosphate/cardiolipin synthase-like enzyme